MNRSLAGSGVKVAPTSALKRVGGACGDAALGDEGEVDVLEPGRGSGSGVVQVRPVFGFSDRLSILSAAHHWVGVAADAPGTGQGAQPGG